MYLLMVCRGALALARGAWRCVLPLSFFTFVGDKICDKIMRQIEGDESEGID